MKQEEWGDKRDERSEEKTLIKPLLFCAKHLKCLISHNPFNFPHEVGTIIILI